MLNLSPEQQAEEKKAVDAVAAGIEKARAAMSPAQEAPAAQTPPVTPAAPSTSAPAATEQGTPQPQVASESPKVLSPEEQRLKDKDDFIIQLQKENKETRETLQHLLEQTQASQGSQTEILKRISEKLTAEAPLTEEQKADKVAKDLMAINKDPEGYIRSLIASQQKDLQEKLKGIEESTSSLQQRYQPLESQAIMRSQIQYLSENGFEKEVGNSAFMEAMRSRENVEKVYNRPAYYGKPAEEVFADPLFWERCATQAKLDAKDAFASTTAQSAEDKAKMAAASAAATAVGSPSGGSGPATPGAPKTQAQAFKETVRDIKNPGDTLRAAFAKAGLGRQST